MSLLHFRRVERRRTARAVVCVKVLVYGETETGKKFRYWTKSVSVSAYGGVVLLEGVLEVGQIISVVNEFSGKKAEGRLVGVRSARDGQVHGSFEFVEGGEGFWGMAFPAAGAKPLRRLVPKVAMGG